ncbi:pectinesterase family protein, partial [Thermodesulfovibrionales bacterium]|nr:pectinesterase family protein [Thermodesulfovibrionales bacterium]
MTGDQVHGEKFCPACEKKLSAPLPSLCEQCGWDLESDITLNVWATEIPEQTRNRYTQRLAIVKRNWQKLTKLEAAEKSSAGIEEPAKPQDRPAPDRLVVAPDGSGDVLSLAEAVAQAQAGTRIYLKAGVHRLEWPLLIDKSLTLIGDGRGSTRVVCAGKDYVIKFRGGGPFIARDLTFEYQGSQWAHAVEVDGGKVDFQRCRFTGGVRDEEREFGGHGLQLLGEAEG